MVIKGNKKRCKEIEQRKSIDSKHDRVKDIKIEKIENIKLKKNHLL